MRATGGATGPYMDDDDKAKRLDRTNQWECEGDTIMHEATNGIRPMCQATNESEARWRSTII